MAAGESRVRKRQKEPTTATIDQVHPALKRSFLLLQYMDITENFWRKEFVADVGKRGQEDAEEKRRNQALTWDANKEPMTIRGRRKRSQRGDQPESEAADIGVRRVSSSRNETKA